MREAPAGVDRLAVGRHHQGGDLAVERRDEGGAQRPRGRVERQDVVAGQGGRAARGLDLAERPRHHGHVADLDHGFDLRRAAQHVGRPGHRGGADQAVLRQLHRLRRGGDQPRTETGDHRQPCPQCDPSLLRAPVHRPATRPKVSKLSYRTASCTGALGRTGRMHDRNSGSSNSDYAPLYLSCHWPRQPGEVPWTDGLTGTCLARTDLGSPRHTDTGWGSTRCPPDTCRSPRQRTEVKLRWPGHEGRC